MKASFAVRPLAAAICAAALLPLPASATDGYFAHGYGMRAKGMGGASYGLALDAMGGANNPASMAFVGTRIDVGIDWFSPQRSASRTAPRLASTGPSTATARTSSFRSSATTTCSARTSRSASPCTATAGMNTDYPGDQLNCGMGPNTANCCAATASLGQDLSQLIVAPTLAWKFAPTQAIGIAPLFGYQRFKAEGLQAFDNAPGFPPFTSAPGYVTNNGYDSSERLGGADRLSGRVRWLPHRRRVLVEDADGQFRQVQGPVRRAGRL